jgi:hypothetical protein
MSRIQIYTLLYCLTGLLGAVNAYFLFRRRLHRESPWFVAYLMTLILDEVIGGSLFQFVEEPVYAFVYYYTSWMFNAWLLVFSSMFIIEGIRNALVNYGAVRKWGRNVLTLIGVGVLFVAIWSLPYGAEHSDQYMKVTHLAMRSARMVQLSVIVAFFLISSYLALAWRHYQFGVLLGFGLYAAVSLSCETFLAQMGFQVGFKTMVVDCIAYLLTLVMWLGYIVRTEPKPPTLPPSATKDLDQWNEALTGLIKK